MTREKLEPKTVEYGYMARSQKTGRVFIKGGYPTYAALRRYMLIRRLQRQGGSIIGMVGRLDNGPWLTVEAMR